MEEKLAAAGLAASVECDSSDSEGIFTPCCVTLTVTIATCSDEEGAIASSRGASPSSQEPVIAPMADTSRHGEGLATQGMVSTPDTVSSEVLAYR